MSRSNARAMDWCIANDLLEAAVVYGHAAGETDTVAGLVDALALPLYYDGRMETVEEWLGWFSDDELAALPGARRLRGLDPRADRAACRGRAVARARRRGDLGDPALGRQRHDRAVGRHPAGAHDARRCRAGARRRRSGAEPAPAGELLAADRAADPRRRPRAARRNRSCDGRPHGGRRDGAGGRRRRRGLPRTRTARAPRGQAGSLGRGRATRAGGAGRRRRGGPRRLRVERDRARGDGAGRAPRGTARGRPRGTGARPPPAAAARPRHSRG